MKNITKKLLLPLVLALILTLFLNLPLLAASVNGIWYENNGSYLVLLQSPSDNTIIGVNTDASLSHSVIFIGNLADDTLSLSSLDQKQQISARLQGQTISGSKQNDNNESAFSASLILQYLYGDYDGIWKGDNNHYYLNLLLQAQNNSANLIFDLALENTPPFNAQTTIFLGGLNNNQYNGHKISDPKTNLILNFSASEKLQGKYNLIGQAQNNNNNFNADLIFALKQPQEQDNSMNQNNPNAANNQDNGNAQDTQNTNNTQDNSSSDVNFVLDPGYRLNFASNSRIMDYQNGQLSLGFEYHASEMANEPGERGYIAFSTDGLNFSGMRKFEPGENMGKGIYIGGVYRRYYIDEANGQVISETSTDGETYTADEGSRYDLNQYDAGSIGVRTVFVDKYGGVVLIYNHNEIEDNGEEVIYVRRAYSEPGDNGMHFTMTDLNLLEERYEDGQNYSYNDPNAIVLPDGRVRLIVMYQDRYEPKPPMGRTGTIYSFISEDGSTFTKEAELFSWQSFSEFEVHSLNDPKIVRFDDGSYHIFVTAMIPLETGEEDNTGNGGYKTVIVSATQAAQ